MYIVCTCTYIHIYTCIYIYIYIYIYRRRFISNACGSVGGKSRTRFVGLLGGRCARLLCIYIYIYIHIHIHTCSVAAGASGSARPSWGGGGGSPLPFSSAASAGRGFWLDLYIYILYVPSEYVVMTYTRQRFGGRKPPSIWTLGSTARSSVMHECLLTTSQLPPDRSLACGGALGRVRVLLSEGACGCPELRIMVTARSRRRNTVETVAALTICACGRVTL